MQDERWLYAQTGSGLPCPTGDDTRCYQPGFVGSDRHRMKKAFQVWASRPQAAGRPCCVLFSGFRVVSVSHVPCGCRRRQFCFLQACGPFTRRMTRSSGGTTPAHFANPHLIHSCHLSVPRRIVCGLRATHKGSCGARPEPDYQTCCHRWGGLLSVNPGPLGAPLCEDSEGCGFPSEIWWATAPESA